MMRLVTLCASSALLMGCTAASGLAPGGGVVEPNRPTPPVPTGRTISYRTASFTDPTLDVSPDGQRLYFAAMGEIYAVPVSGGLAEPLPLGSGWKERPVISPDGLSIGFLADRGAGIAAWRSPLMADRPATGEAVPGYEARTLAWVDKDSLVSAGASTSDASGLGLTVDYQGEHGHARLDGHDKGGSQPGWTAYSPASMSADHEGNVFLHRHGRIVGIDALTGIEDVVVLAGADTISQPRVTSDGDWLGFATLSGGTAHLMLKNLASGESRSTGCKLNPWGETMNQGSPGREPSYAFIPGQQAVILERDGAFHRCTFEGVETPIPVEAEVRIDVARRIRPALVQQTGAPRVPLDLASTGNGRMVAFNSAGHVWIQDRSTGQSYRISTSDALERSPAFSPDGRSLAYVERFQDQSSNLRVLDLGTGTSTVLVHSQDALGAPAWSPDSRRIAFVEVPLTSSNDDSTLRWLGLDGSAGVVGQIANPGWEPFPRIAWARSGSAILYTQWQSPNLNLISRPLDGEPQQLLSADHRVRDLLVSPSGRFVALRTRDGVYTTPIVLSSGDRPAFSWSDIRSMNRVWEGGVDHLQWLADDSLMWTVQNTVMQASPGQSPREVADLSLPAEPTAEPERHAYVGATVVSMDRAGTIDDAVIVTRGRTLEYVGTREGAPNLTAIKTTDLTGKWIVPGFVDVHAHNLATRLSEYNAPVSRFNLAELSFGVTTVFDPSATSFVESTVAWAMSQRDDFLGPTIYGTGIPLLGNAGHRNLMDVESYGHALLLASDIAGRGGLMIKNYRQDTRQQRQWLAQAARAYGLGVVPDEDETLAVILPLIMDGYTGIEHTFGPGTLREDVKQFLIESQASLTPTLATGAFAAGFVSESGSPDLRRDCLFSAARFTNGSRVPGSESLISSGMGAALADYADLLNRGARVTIGGHGEAWGLDFHWELELLAMGGATPTTLLQAATMNGAEKLGLEAQIGSLVQGKDADFIVLNASPLDDIRNARNIERVVRRGRVVTWPAGPAPQSWKSATSWDECQRWNFGLDGSEAPARN